MCIGLTCSCLAGCSIKDHKQYSIVLGQRLLQPNESRSIQTAAVFNAILSNLPIKKFSYGVKTIPSTFSIKRFSFWIKTYRNNKLTLRTTSASIFAEKNLALTVIFHSRYFIGTFINLYMNLKSYCRMLI